MHREEEHKERELRFKSTKESRSQGEEDRRSPEEAASTRSDFAPNAWLRLEYARAAIEFRHDQSRGARAGSQISHLIH